MLTIPPRPRLLSPILLFYGLGLFVWLTPEDRGVVGPTILGLGVALLGAAHLITRQAGRVIPARFVMPFLVGVGAAIGASTALAATGLMFLKNAVHAHLFPDYPPLLLLAMLERIPAWAVTGALIGLAVALLRRV